MSDSQPSIAERSVHGARMTRVPAVVHLDLDGATHIYRIHGWHYRAPDDALFESGIRRALDFFEDADLRATLFVIAEDLDDPVKRTLLCEAVRRGHEVASHSFTHRRLTDLSRAEKRTEIVDSKERLQADLGVRVRGFRAPAFALDAEALELICEAGYEYDSSCLSNGRNAVPAWEGDRLIELPIPTYSIASLPFHPCCSLVTGLWNFRLGLWCFRRTTAPLVLLFHLTDFADPLPARQLPGLKARVFTLSHLSGEYKRRRCRQMLELTRRSYELVDTSRLLMSRCT